MRCGDSDRRGLDERHTRAAEREIQGVGGDPGERRDMMFACLKTQIW